MNSDTMQTLSFVVEDELYAIPLGAVREVIRSVAISTTHDSDGIEGYINLRGSILPVVDIRHLIGLPASRNRPEHRLLIIEHPDACFAIRTNQLPQIYEAKFERCTATHSLIDGVSGQAAKVIKLLSIDRVATSICSSLSVTSIEED